MVPGAISGLELGSVGARPLLTGYVAPPEVPQTVPGLLAWWDVNHPETLGYDAGTARVSSWASRVGSYTLTQPNVPQMPIYFPSGNYSHDGLYFDGQDDSLVCNELGAAMSGYRQLFSWYIVIRFGNLDGNRVLMSVSGAMNGHETYWHYLEANGAIGFISQMDNGNGGGGVGGYANGNLFVGSFTYRGDAGFVRSNGQGMLYAGAGGSQFTAYLFRVCAAANGSACCHAVVSEVLVYNAFHDDDVRPIVENYLRNKYATG